MNVTSILPRSALTLLFVALSPVVVRAQSVVNPTRAEFTPSADHSATLPDGSPTVDHYELEFYLIGAATPFQVATLGKPAPEPDGVIRVNFASVLTSYPAPGIVYDAAVTAVGSSGVGRSTLSNTFSFSTPTPCSFTVSPTSQTVVAAGGTASATVTTTSGCSWIATSNVSWITVTVGSSGNGNGTINYTVTANTSANSRSANLTVAGQTVTVAQLAVKAHPKAPKGVRVTQTGK